MIPNSLVRLPTTNERRTSQDNPFRRSAFLEVM
jgi:hypothetical protein